MKLLLLLATASASGVRGVDARSGMNSTTLSAAALSGLVSELKSGRRLWGFQWPDSVPDPSKLKDEVGGLAEQAGSHVSNAAGQAGQHVSTAANQVSATAQSSFNFVKDTFNDAQKLIEEGLHVVRDAAESSSQFSAQMTNLFEDFKPLQPIFGATHGIVPLLTSQKNLGTLVNFLVDLLREASQLARIGDAVAIVSSMFQKLYELFSKELDNLNEAVDNSQGEGGRRLFAIDYNALLGGLDFSHLKKTFDDFHDQAIKYVDRVKDINTTISPLLRTVQQHVGGGRRLNPAQALEELKEGQVKYEGAILSVVPTWQSVENLAIDVCTQTDLAITEVVTLKCRVSGFASNVQLPGIGGVNNILDECESENSPDTVQVEVQCPGTAQSAEVRDMLSESAGVLGWIAVTFEWIVRNTTATRIFLGILLLALGIAVGFFGYRYKDCEFWIEGFLAGMVVWSIVVSVIIVYFGVCQGEAVNEGSHLCEPTWLLLVVLLLSIMCAVLTVKGQKIQLFLGGFDLGAILGGCLYIWRFSEQIFNTFITVNSDEAKVIMGWFLFAALALGLVLGGLTVLCEKPVLIIGTSFIGGFVIVIAFGLFFPHWLDWGDLVAWIVLSVVAIAVQFLVTAHGAPKVDDSGEESKPLNA